MVSLGLYRICGVHQPIPEIGYKPDGNTELESATTNHRHLGLALVVRKLSLNRSARSQPKSLRQKRKYLKVDRLQPAGKGFQRLRLVRTRRPFVHHFR